MITVLSATSSGTITPPDIPQIDDLYVYLDTGRSTMISDAPGVSYLSDLSGNGLHAAQNGFGLRPSLEALAGLSGIRFRDGQHLRLPTLGGVPLSGAVLAVVPSQANADQVAITQDSTAATTDPAFEVRAR